METIICSLEACIANLPEDLQEIYHKFKDLRLSWILTEEKLDEIQSHFTAGLDPDVMDLKGSMVNYENSDIRNYYVLHFMTAYIQVLFSHLNTAYDMKDEYRKWFQRKSGTSGLKIASIGGGAGTEVFAFYLHLCSLKDRGAMVPDVEMATILEKCLAWEEQFRMLNFNGDVLRVEYVEFDLLNKKALDGSAKKIIEDADVVTLVKIISPLRKSAVDHQKIIQSRIENVFQLMKPDSLVLFMDSNFRSKFSRPVEHAAHQCKLKHIFEVHGQFKSESISFMGINVRQNPCVHQSMWIKKIQQSK